MKRKYNEDGNVNAYTKIQMESFDITQSASYNDDVDFDSSFEVSEGNSTK